MNLLDPNPDPQSPFESPNPRPPQSPHDLDGPPSASSGSSPRETLASALEAEFLSPPKAEAVNPSPSEMSRGDFADFFFGVFGMTRSIIAAAPPNIDLKSLNVTAATPGATAAADAAYNLCLKIPAFRPILKVADNPIMSAAVVVIFVGGVSGSAYAEYKAARNSLAAPAPVGP